MERARLDRSIVAEIARRAAHRLQVLAAEAPDLLADRLATWDPDELKELLKLTRLPPWLADREPPRRNVGVLGTDHCMNRLVSASSAEREPLRRPAHVQVEPHELGDTDLLSARRFVPETLPGYFLG